ncbi:MAG: hypothetical protein JWS12_129 [Candidatus Saccharibacteria bacterium]|nr:hypothetical protein [Candidatus Saccharibacteria bacterium]
MKLQQLLTKFKSTAIFFRKYATFMAFVIIILGYSFMVWRINVFTSKEPADADVQNKLAGTKRPVIDQKTVDKIQQLQGNNVQVQTLFKQARDNPFQE